VVAKRIKHPNVMTIEGVAPKLFKYCMVSPWMEGGNMLEYVRKYPKVDRLGLVRPHVENLIPCSLDLS